MTATSDSRRILDLLAQGKITVDEADELLRAVDRPAGQPPSADAAADNLHRAAAKWVRITVDEAGKEGRPPKQVNIRVPMALVRGGVKLGAIFPRLSSKPFGKVQADGIDVDWSKIDLSQIDTVLQNLGETTIDVDEGRARVRITCE